jgi:hypothetical protein
MNPRFADYATWKKARLRRGAMLSAALACFALAAILAAFAALTS